MDYLPQDIKFSIDEYNSLEQELKNIGNQVKILKKRREDIITSISNYMENIKISSIKYRGKTYCFQNKKKLIKK